MKFDMFIFVAIIVMIYFILITNRIVYIHKIYKLDIGGLEKQKHSEVAFTKTKMIRDGTARYASQIAKGIVSGSERVADERIYRRKLQYRYDLISSAFTSITKLFVSR